MDEKEAYREVIGGLTQSQYGLNHIVEAVLHLKTKPLTELRVSLLRRGYCPEECEKLHAEGKYHHLDGLQERI